ncbi:MAG: dockerin type I domain-containing protein [Aureliella sp.]
MRKAVVETLEKRLVMAAGVAVADYQFTNHGLNGQTELFSRDLHPDSVASDITSPLPLGSTGNGEPPRGLALGGAFNETTEPIPATNSTDFFTFSITPADGQPLSLSDLSFAVRRNDPDSKNRFAIYYDEDPGSGGDNFSSRLFAGVVESEDRFERFVVPLEGVADFTNLTNRLTFRYYSWGTAGTGTQRIDNVRVRAVAETVPGSEYAYYGDGQRLIHPLDAQGNRLPDFSSAGYRNSDEPIPDIVGEIEANRIVRVSPINGDDMSNIQAAINQVSAMQPNGSGFRGVVQLAAGEFQISNRIEILTSGVVLRGAGDGSDPASNTILRGTGTLQRALVRVGPASGFASGTGGTRSVTDKYVPVGAKSFHVDSVDGWQVGDEIIVRRPSTAEWIAELGMDNIPPRSDGGQVNQWEPGAQFDHSYERVITRIDGNKLTVNAPLMSSLDRQYGGGLVFKYNFDRIENVGIENVRGVSDFASDTDEEHARTFIELQAVKDAWVTNVTGQHFVYATVHATSRSMRVTVDDARSLDPKSIITGGRRYPFVIDGQFVLMRNLFSEEGRHDFVNNSAWRNRGPNVFLDGVAVNSHSSTGPHQRFSTGTLYDSITTDRETEARNRGNFGTGHGWAGANMVFWNNTSPRYLIQNPPTAQNWLIGSVGPIINDTRFGQQPSATVDAHGTPIDFGDEANPTSSLFVAQRNRADSEVDTSWREFVVGDFDMAEYDGQGSQDALFVDPGWQRQIENAAGSLPIAESDQASASQFVPFTFEFPFAENHRATYAVLSIGLRGTGGETRDDELALDSLNNTRTLESLGLMTRLPTDETSVATIELSEQELELLNDGQLNLLLSENSVVDWAHLELLDEVVSALALDIEDSFISENGGVSSATLTRTGKLDRAVSVQLSTSDETELIVPSAVTLAAGQSTVQFDVTAVDDSLLDGEQSVTVTASAMNYIAASDVVLVQDDEVRQLSIEIALDSISEDGGRGTAMVRRNSELERELVVWLTVDDPSEASVPTSVTIPAGSNVVPFLIRAVDDSLADGDQTVRISATAEEHQPDSDTLVVVDDEVPELSFHFDIDSLVENGEMIQATVARNTATDGSLVVTLASSDEGEATVPVTVEIAAGDSEASFLITAVNDTVVDGDQLVNITAVAAGHAGASRPVSVLDDDQAELTLTIDEAEVAEADGSSRVTVTRNAGGVSDLVVTLLASPDSRISLPEEITIPAGVSSATFQMTAVDDFIVTGDTVISVSASADGFFDGTDVVTILEDDSWSWTNTRDRYDVNDDLFITAIDALLVINYLNGSPPPEFPPLNQRPSNFFDVSGDGFASPIDALMVINELNRSRDGESESEGEGEGEGEGEEDLRFGWMHLETDRKKALWDRLVARFSGI